MPIYDRDWYRGEQKSPYESSTVKQRGRYKYRGPNMKLSSSIILAVIVGYVIAVGYNVTTVHNKMNKEFLTKNGLSILIEVGSRTGLAGTFEFLGILDDILLDRSDVSTVWQASRFFREAVNVLYDWYAPIQWPPILSASKEIAWLRVKAGLENSSKTNDYGYAYVKSNGLNVRSGPSANNRVLATLKMNSRVQVINKTGAWWKIKYGNIEGYVNSTYLKN
jgi:hypothetical protein